MGSDLFNTNIQESKSKAGKGGDDILKLIYHTALNENKSIKQRKFDKNFEYGRCNYGS